MAIRAPAAKAGSPRQHGRVGDVDSYLNEARLRTGDLDHLEQPSDSTVRGLTAGRVTAVVLVLIALRLLFFVFSTEVFAPIDEAHHFGYVSEMAHGRLPNLETPLPRDLLALVDRTEALEAPRPKSEDLFDPTWGSYGKQHEAVQGPVYYALMVPAYWIGRPFGELAALYSVRLLSACVAFGSALLAMAFARQLFPDQPSLRPVAAAVGFVPLAFVGAAGQVTDDVLTVPLGILMAMQIVRAWREPTPRRYAEMGALLGLSVVAKGTMLALLPAVALSLGFGKWRGAEAVTIRTRLLSCGALGAGGAIMVAPWVALSLHRYGDLSPVKAQVEQLRVLLVFVRTDVAGLVDQFTQARLVWALPRQLVANDSYRTLGEAVVGFLLVMAFVSACHKRDRRALLVLAFSLVAAVGAVLALFVLSSSGGSEVRFEGRYFLPLMVPFLVVVSGVVMSRVHLDVARVVLLTACTVMFIGEGAVIRAWSAGYAGPSMVVSGNAVVSVDQRRGDAYVDVSVVHVSAPCPVAFVAVYGEPDERIEAHIDGSPLNRVALPLPYNVNTWQLEPRQLSVFDLTVSNPSSASRSARVAASTSGTRVDPVLRAWCRSGSATDEGFTRAFDKLHPVHLTREMLTWPSGVLAAASGGAALLCATASVVRRTRKQARR